MGVANAGHRARRRMHADILWLVVVAFALLPGMVRAALPGEQNNEPELCQGVAGASYAVNVALSIAAPPPLDQTGDALAYIANLNLKLCEPQIEAPGDIYGVEPDTLINALPLSIRKPSAPNTTTSWAPLSCSNTRRTGVRWAPPKPITSTPVRTYASWVTITPMAR